MLATPAVGSGAQRADSIIDSHDPAAEKPNHKAEPKNSDTKGSSTGRETSQRKTSF